MKQLLFPKNIKLRHPIIITWILVLFSLTSASQSFKGVYIKGDSQIVTIFENDTISIVGSLKASEDPKIFNRGHIYITDSLINETSGRFFDLVERKGTLHYVGNDTLFIIGDTTALIGLALDSALAADDSPPDFGAFADVAVAP